MAQQVKVQTADTLHLSAGPLVHAVKLTTKPPISSVPATQHPLLASAGLCIYMYTCLPTEKQTYTKFKNKVSLRKIEKITVHLSQQTQDVLDHRDPLVTECFSNNSQRIPTKSSCKVWKSSLPAYIQHYPGGSSSQMCMGIKEIKQNTFVCSIHACQCRTMTYL